MFLTIKIILMKIIFRPIALAMIGCLVVLCGCESLPDGDPPIGPIVDASMPKSRLVSIDQAVNYMTTSLTAACIQHGLMGKAILKPFSDTYSNKVFYQVANITSIVVATGTVKPKLLLSSKFIKQPQKMIWEMGLINLTNNKMIWHEQKIINFKSSLVPTKK